MIRPLRQRHRHVAMALGIFLPIVFTVGIAARKPVPEITSLPERLAPGAAQFDTQEWQRGDLFPKSPVQVRLLRENKGAGKFALKFSAGKNFVKPDLLVYWAAENSNVTDKLPDSSILLGSFNATPLPLSDAIVTASGWLVLFSLADQEIVDVSGPIRFNDLAPR